jgi:Ca2+/H+ antiporter
VTVIEVALIVSVMLSSGPEKAGLARDTVFAAVMIICNGIGVCLFVGGLHHREQAFQAPGANAAMAILVALLGLTMVLPNFTSSTPGPMLSPSQLAFAGAMSLVLYGSFVFVQTVRHRDYFWWKQQRRERACAAASGRGSQWRAAGRLPGGRGGAGQAAVAIGGSGRIGCRAASCRGGCGDCGAGAAA